MITLLFLICFGVTIGPGWSEPFLATDSANSMRPIQFLERDDLGRFHLIWAGFNEARIAYKMFDIDGTTLFPDTMISRDVNSVYLTTVTMGDSLFAFWRESNPVYYAIRSLTDGSEITPATHIFTNYTMYPYIRTSPDSLGRLHVLYNDNIGDVIYSVWNPAPGSGFVTEYSWAIAGAHDGGVVLVDGERVHVVTQDPAIHDYLYIQYDLEGNTVVPLTDFTTQGDIQICGRFPDVAVDSAGDLLVVEEAFANSLEAIYLWKLNGETGELLVDMEPLVISEPPAMYTSGYVIVKPFPVADQFYLCWVCGNERSRVAYLVFDSDGNIIHNWVTAYDYTDEDPEDTSHIDGVSDEDGNLYIVYCQVETDPQIDYFPTFGWLDYNYVGISEENASAEPVSVISFSNNPIKSSVTVYSNTGSQALRVFDIAGREVSSISVSDGVGVWFGTGFTGERLPTGVYSILDSSGEAYRITLLSR